MCNWALLGSAIVQSSNDCGTVLCEHQDRVLQLLCSGTVLIALSVVVFFTNIVPKYRTTFYKRDSYKNMMRRTWHTYSVEEIEMVLSTRLPLYWPKDLAKQWLEEHWERLEREKPGWFVDPVWREGLPVECWPSEEIWLEWEHRRTNSEGLLR